MECICGCDGSFFCQGQSLTEIIEIACYQGDCRRIGCGGCSVFGENHAGDSSFPIIYGGLKLQCKCSCNGDYICAGSAGQVIVQCVGGVGCLTSQCQQCIVNGRRYDGGAVFPSSYKGVAITCTCGCDGTSYCVGVSTSIEVSCTGRDTCTRIGCRECFIFGQEYLGSSSVDFIYRGVPVTCTCDCEGGYTCRSVGGQTPEVVCRDGDGQDCLKYECRGCEVDGNIYRGTTSFDYIYNGIQMRCQCGCDSSYYCKGVRELIELTCVGGSCNVIGCDTCSVYGKQIPGASSFTAVYVGVLLNCQCRCDGSYECFGAQDGVSVFRCRNNLGTCFTSACQSCSYNGQTYAGGSVFTETYKDMPMSCTCGCDSSIFCTGEQSLTLTCIGGRCTHNGCNSCNVFGKTFDGFSTFPLVYSGYMLNCQCDCSGGYICQGEITVQCRNGGRDCLPQTCGACRFDGNVIQGYDTFKYKYLDHDVSCTCGCDGNVYCNGVTTNIELRCLGDTCNPIGCSRCKYYNQEYPAFEEFQIIHQGVKLDCSCGCNSYKCEGGAGAVVIDCGSSDCGPRECSQCSVDGSLYNAFQRFRSRYKDIELECECGCDGSAYCTGTRDYEGVEVTCIGGVCAPRNCQSCSVFGQEYDSFTGFAIIYEGVELNCRCSCDSSYICRGSSGNVVVSCQQNGRSCLPQVCRDCFVDGIRRSGRQKFPYMFEGIEMECTCGCDGSSYCLGTYVNMSVSCIGNNCTPRGCRSCSVFGEEHQSPSAFDIIYQGTRLSCKCSCDSSYICVGTTGATVIDCQSGRSCLPEICKDCNVNGNSYKSFTKFPYRYRDIDMRCECGCDGTSYCRGVSVEYEVSCIGPRCAPTSCGTCNIFGQEHPGDSTFPLVYRGDQLSCKCECDTSYRCVGSSPDVKSIECGINEDCLKKKCRKCRVNGQRYDGGDRFDFKWRTYDMSCVCGCDGSYFCRGKSTDIEIGCLRPRGQGCRLTGGCRNCNIFGKDYKGDSSHKFVYRGYFMTCNCKCDSSYQCLGVDNQVIRSCPADRPCFRNCRTCRIDGRSYPGLSTFDTVYEGKNMECTCGCDGSYYCQCKDDDSKVACSAQGKCKWDGCSTCRSDGVDYQGLSEFRKVYDGIQMSCKCNCDGSYKCTGRDVSITIICTGDNCRVDGCRSCIENGREHRYGSQFVAMREGKRHRCRCNCDGTSTCRKIRERVCKTCTIDGKSYRGHTRHRIYRGEDSYICDCYCEGTHKCDLENKGCSKCLVNGRRYNANTQFATIMEGKRVECTCECNGEFQCTGDNIICTSRGCRSTCTGCEIEGKVYDGDTSFRIFHRGENLDMDCTCQCGGSYECTGEKRICTSRGCESTCSKCEIEGSMYTGGTTFSIFHRGQNIEMECKCGCDGSYECTGGTIVCTSSGGCRDTCSGCQIQGATYKGDSTFTIYSRRFDVNMTCNCECGGNYQCKGGTVTCTQAGCKDSCPGCLIENNKYKGGSNFKIFSRANNIDMDCTCQCGGSYECRGETVICTSAGCRETCSGCNIEGATYKGDSTHTVYHQGYNMNMQCSCQCGGSYECRGGTVICTQAGCQDTCTGCVIEGKTYRGKTSPTIYHAGYKINMDCTCQCGGNYECRGGTVTCTQSGCQDSCPGCNINGATYKGGSTPTIYHQTYKINMDCTCQCGGNYECRGGTVTCTQSGCQDSCSGCNINGATYKGGSTPTIYHQTYNINMDCTCQCGGSYECRGGTVICNQGGCRDTCFGCTIEGKTYNGGSSFKILHRGNNIDMDCTCQCGGVYECRGESFICTQSGCQDTCSSCEIQGRTYKGDTTFTIFHTHYDMDMSCHCKCGGSYTCKGVKYTESCIGPGCPNPDCRDCVYQNRRYPGNTRFPTVVDDVPVQCTCDCGGNLNCKGEAVINRTCVGPDCGSRGCRRCPINGRLYSGNTRFEIKEDKYDMECSCYCDGSYSCTTSTGVTTSCVGEKCADKNCRPCRLDGRTYSVDTKFRLTKNNLIMNCVCECDGAYRCFSITGSCVGDGCDEFGCSSCKIDGRLYKGGTEFQLNPGTICTCSCSGEFSCRTSSLSIQCVGANCGEGGCKQCLVDGQLQTGNQRFQFRDYGLFMQCVCNCDSSYTCRGYQIIGNEDDVDRNCKQCQIGGRFYNGRTRFQVLIDGERKVCSCACDGSHSCSTLRSECRQCVVGGETYSPNSPFTLTRGGNSIQCRCGCTGDFVCEGRKDIVGSVIDGCQDCYIFGSRYKSDRKFTTDVGGIRMLCECFCNGGYECKGYRTVSEVVLPEQRPPVEECNTCVVGDEEHPGQSRFTIRRGCFQISCACECDGSWECPSQIPKYVCQDEREEIYYYSLVGSAVYENDPDASVATRLISNSRTVFGTGACRSCFLNNQEFKGNTGFTLQDGCLRFTCQCDCSGGWNCTSVEGSDCSFQNPFTNPDPFKKQCRECVAFGKAYPPEKRFYPWDECYKYNCMCNCDGSFECPRELTVKTCPDNNDIYDPAKGNCRQCVVGKDSYDVGQNFKITENCKQYTCKCDCDGSYYCPGSTAVQVCRGGSGLPGRLPGLGSRTLNQTGRTFVAIRPSGIDSLDGKNKVRGEGGYLITGREIITPDGFTVVSGARGQQGGVVSRGPRVYGGGSRVEGGTRIVAHGSRVQQGGGEMVVSQSAHVVSKSGQVGGVVGHEGHVGGQAGGVVGQAGHAAGQAGYTKTVYSQYGVVGQGVGGQYDQDGGVVGAQSRAVDGHAGDQQGVVRRGQYRAVGGGGGQYGGVGGDAGGEVAELKDARGAPGNEGWAQDFRGLVYSKDCGSCNLNGETIPGGRDFTFRTGCLEYLCECFCDGTYTCPESNKTNFCNKGAVGEDGKGCRVNNRVYRMNLFSYIEDCRKYSCRCYKDGRYKCKKKTRKVC